MEKEAHKVVEVVQEVVLHWIIFKLVAIVQLAQMEVKARAQVVVEGYGYGIIIGGISNIIPL